MIVFHQSKVINTNTATLANKLLSTDLIAALAGCGLLAGGEVLIIRGAGTRCSSVQPGFFLISIGLALQRPPSPRSVTRCCNYSRTLSDGSCAPAAH